MMTLFRRPLCGLINYLDATTRVPLRSTLVFMLSPAPQA